MKFRIHKLNRTWGLKNAAISNWLRRYRIKSFTAHHFVQGLLFELGISIKDFGRMQVKATDAIESRVQQKANHARSSMTSRNLLSTSRSLQVEDTVFFSKNFNVSVLWLKNEKSFQVVKSCWDKIVRACARINIIE